MCNLHNNKGFTLLEILVAILVLSIGLLGMAALTGGIIHNNKFSKELTTATILAQDQMEEIRRLGYSGTPSTDTDATEDYNSITNYPSYKRVTSTRVNNPAAGMKKATVTVCWDSDSHSVALQTILAE